ncbi:S41 family peptidase [Marinicella sp. W31]|uniref:S41 family peptidase n=1 Tax=Marinicella sp. W31 TaxID=3023713 RepID=UPI003756707E
MKKYRQNLLLFIILTFSLSSSVTAQAWKDRSNHLDEDLQAFAKLYGYVRYFHPTDEALAVDWDAFLLYGIQRIQTRDKPLDEALNALFAPIVQGVHVFAASDPKPIIKSDKPSDNAQLKNWQHYGLGEDAPALYNSSRVPVISKQSLHSISSRIRVKDILNYKYRLSARIKVSVEDSMSGGRLVFSGFGENFQPSAINIPFENLIRAHEWQRIELTGTIEQEVIGLIMGAELLGTGKMWIDDFQLSVSEDGIAWESLELPNHQFNASNKGQAIGWFSKDNDLYDFQVINEDDNPVLQIQGYEWSLPGAIFKQKKSDYTVLTKVLNSQWKVHLPVTVWDSPGDQLNDSFSALEGELKAINMGKLTGADEILRLANVIKMWNVLQHFYPYFDVVNVDWNATLLPAIATARTDKNEWQHARSLMRLMALIEDGHGAIYTPHSLSITGIPVAVKMIANEMVVTSSRIREIKTGDVIQSINGIKAVNHLKEQQKLVSGSPHLVEFRTLNQIGLGEVGEDVKLMIQRDTYEFEHAHRRDAADSKWSSLFFNTISDHDFPTVKELEPGIFYVNLNKITTDDFRTHLEQLANAQGIIFDQRWDGKLNSEQRPISSIRDLLPHLTEKVVTSGYWQVPQIIWPDREQMTFGGNSWQINPKEPYFKGKKVFINVPSVVSVGETFTGMLDHYGLAEFVGEPTAGCNGNINYIRLFNGYSAMYTGMKVEKHDGNQLHLIGYQPDHPVIQSKAGIVSGKDEFLEAAIKAVKQ